MRVDEITANLGELFEMDDGERQWTGRVYQTNQEGYWEADDADGVSASIPTDHIVGLVVACWNCGSAERRPGRRMCPMPRSSSERASASEQAERQQIRGNR